MKLLYYFIPITLGNFIELNRDGDTQYPTYYKDDTSPSRTLPWMYQDEFKTSYPDFLTDTACNGDDGECIQDTTRTPWSKQTIINLGNGIKVGNSKTIGVNSGDYNEKTIDGTSSTDEFVNLIQKTREYYIESGNGDGVTNQPNTETGIKNAWDHIRRFWYRDGQLFALMMDDTVNDMMYTDDEDFIRDVSISISEDDNDEIDQVRFRFEEENHHIELLRNFCKTMGSTLWAPSSQAEYDDLMERSDGICQQDPFVMNEGEIIENSSTELYLNLHREGHLKCPNHPKLVPADSNLQENCQTAGYQPLEAADQWRKVSNDDGNYRFFTTDKVFSKFYKHATSCSQPESRADFPYAHYNILQTDAQCYNLVDPDQTDSAPSNPYLPKECIEDASKQRFQKFEQSEYKKIDKLYGVTNSGSFIRQKDCVVTACKQRNSLIGPANDQRKESAWTMEKCNQQKTVGVCRIPLKGCNNPTFVCKDTNNCGIKSIYTETTEVFCSADVKAAVEAVRALGVLTADQQEGIDKATLFTEDVIRTRDIVLYSTAEEKAILENWAEKPADVVIVQRDDTHNPTEVCKCDCNLNNYDTFKAKIGVDFMTDTNLPQVVTPINDDINAKAEWQCEDKPNHVEGCWTGEVKAECLLNDEGTVARWMFTQPDEGLPNNIVCVNNCCDDYDDIINTKGKITSSQTRGLRAGDEITITCDAGYHIDGEANKVKTKTQVVGARPNCFVGVVCVEDRCEKPQTIEHGYCYDKDDLTGEQLSWAIDEKLRCRCEVGYVMRSAFKDLPFTTVACKGKVGEVAKFENVVGECVQEKCGNVLDLVNGWANEQTANVGDSVEYTCAAGFKFENGIVPSSKCEDEESEDGKSRTKQYAFRVVVGGCVPDDSDDPPGCTKSLEDVHNAWSPLYMDITIDDENCHTPANYNGDFANRKIKQFNDDSKVTFAEGAQAIYECYSDFIAVPKENFLELGADLCIENNCAEGPKTDDPRTENTKILISNHETDNDLGVATDNDKLVSTCVNGKWTEPAYKCACKDEYMRSRETVVSQYNTLFNYKCPEVIAKYSSSPRILYTTLGLVPAVFLLK